MKRFNLPGLKSEFDPRSLGERRRRQIGDVHAESRIVARQILDAVPVIRTPMDAAGGQRFDAQRLAGRQRAYFVIEPPYQPGRDGVFDQVTLHGLRRNKGITKNSFPSRVAPD